MSDAEGIDPTEQDNGLDEQKIEKLIPKGSIIDRDVDLSQTPTAALKAELEAAVAEARENHDKYLRALADLENYKKRALKERSDLVKYQGERIFMDILDIGDDLERAIQHADSDPAHLKTGIEMIYKRFTDILAKWEVKGESAIGKEFNPNLHHALSKVVSPGAKAGTIIGELKKVFTYKDKVLRHGEVVVAEDAPNSGEN